MKKQPNFPRKGSWRWRITGNQEAKLLQVLDTLDMPAEEAIAALHDKQLLERVREELIGYIREAAEKSGEFGGVPLVDDLLIAKLNPQRARYSPRPGFSRRY